MKDIEYFTLRSIVYYKEKNRKVLFSMGNLAKEWHYTKQNVKKKLRKYEELGLLNYIPGKGRGNFSTLIFQESFPSEIQANLIKCINNKDMKFALELSQLDIPQEWFMPFIEEFQALFKHTFTDNSDNILRFVINRRIAPLDPCHSSLHFEAYLIKQISDTLVSYSEKSDTYTPLVAIDWKHNNNFTEWTFYIRKNIFFHDGTKLTGNDVLYSFNQAKLSSTGDWILNDLKDMYCSSDFVVHFLFKTPEPLFLKLITHYSLVIRSTLSQNEKFIGCGPFILFENKENSLSLKTFQHYYHEQPLVKGIEFWIIDLKIKKWLVLPSLDINNTPSNYSETKDIGVKRSGVNYLIFNQKKIPSIDKALVNALKKVFDTSNLIRDLYDNKVTEAYSYFPNYSQKEATVFEVKEEEITMDLKLSNYTGEPLVLAIFNHPKLIREAEWFKNKSSVYNINIQIKTYSFNDNYYEEDIVSNADMALATDIPVTDIELGYLDFLLNKSLLFQRFISEKHLSNLIRLANTYKQSTLLTEKKEIFLKMEDYIQKENLLIYLYYPQKYYNIHNYINGVEFDSNGDIGLKKLWWS